MNIYDEMDKCGWLLGRHLDGPTHVTVERLTWDDLAGQAGLVLHQLRRVLWLDDEELAFCEYAGKTLQLHPRGDDIWIA